MLGDEYCRQIQSEGHCTIPDVLSAETLARCREALERGIAEKRKSGLSTHDVRLDPNAANIRMYNLPELDPCFIDLLRHPTGLAAAEAVIGPHLIVSNFTANNALPGSRPMRVHSDQALSIPPPWNNAWVVNVIWCFDDIDAENGATCYVPRSHRFRNFEEVPFNIEEKMRSFEAAAGAIVVMDGRLWHSSGANTSTDRQRRLAFAYYGMDFIRQQTNWEAALSAQTKCSLDDEGRRLFGLGAAGNTRIGGNLTRL